MSSSKSFEEKERENNLITLVKGYEEKVNNLDRNIDELNNKRTNSDVLARGYHLAIKYWLAMIGVNLILFPIIGYIQGVTTGYILEHVIAGLSFWMLSSIAIGGTCLFGNFMKKAATRKSNELSIQIENKEEAKKNYEKELSELKKHITPAHIEYDFVQKSSELDQIENVTTYVNKEIDDSSILGPTLVKRNIKRRK